MLNVKPLNYLDRDLQPGDRVLIRCSGGTTNWNVKMGKYCGSVMTVRKVDTYEYCYKMEEDIDDFLDNVEPGWNWYRDAIEGLVISEYEDILEDTSLWQNSASLDALLT